MDYKTLRFPHVVLALQMAKPLAQISAFSCFTVLAAYAFDVEKVFRPLTNGPATHPMTAIMLGLMAIGVSCFNRHSKNILTLSCSIAALILAIWRLYEINFLADSLIDNISPFQRVLESAAQAGKPIKMGWNTALFGILACASVILTVRRQFTAAQISLAIGLTLPFIGLTGFAYGINKFHGQMSLTTIFIIIPLAHGILFQSAHRGALRHILNPWIAGKLARIQLSCGLLVPVVLGYVVIKTAADHPLDTFGIYVVIICTFITGLVSFSTVVHERYEHRRRSAERKLDKAALEDPLTGLPNRRFLFAHGKKIVARHSRNQQALSLLMLDIDHFKIINDSYGHEMGDEVLKKIASMLPSLLRRQDLIARYGGEEFTILLPDTSAAGGRVIAEKIIAAISNAAFPHNQQTTISIGCAEYCPCQTFEQLLSAADKQLYLAKETGRNRVK